MAHARPSFESSRPKRGNSPETADGAFSGRNKTAPQERARVTKNPGPESAEKPDGALPAEDRKETREAADLLSGLDAVEQELFGLKKSASETKLKINALRSGIGLPPTEMEPPSAELRSKRVQALEERQSELRGQLAEWVEQNGAENLPEGRAIELDENTRAAKAGSEKEKKENLEARKAWIKEWEKKAAKDFEKAIQNDWRTKDAVNLELAIEIMKIRVPEEMDKRAADFIAGKTNLPPFSVVWIRWQTPTSFQKLMGAQNYIKKLEVTFDKESEEIAEEAELKPKEPVASETADRKQNGQNTETWQIDRDPHGPKQ